tara:strand:+ start:286 stop:678 length:393 start_codon:yes stop_codon:yes gene_type:complete
MKMNNKNTRKSYAYGSMVRKPMQMGGNMSTNMNPMMPRAQQSMPEPITPMSNSMDKMAMGGKMKKMAEGGKLMETRQEIKDRVSKKDPNLSKSQLSRAYNIARGMDPSGRLSDQDVSRVVNVLRGMQKPR